MKRRSFFGAFAAMCCLPFAKKEVGGLRTFVSTPNMTSWKHWTFTYEDVTGMRPGDWSYEDIDGSTT